MSLYTNDIVDLKICSVSCGTVITVSDCMSETFYVTISSFPNNVFTWMERIAAAQHKNYISHLGLSCFLVEHSSSVEGPNCLECFQGAENWKISQLTYLILLQTDPAAADKLKCFFETPACKDVQLMPDLMCHYKRGGIKTDFDLNQDLEGDRPGSSVGGTSEPNLMYFAKVMVVKWDAAGTEKAFYECFICLTRKRKVVLISVIKQYVWMVPSEAFPSCETCIGMVGYGPQFPYNQHLRQVQVEYVANTLRKTQTEA